ncbi:acylneuraminate cytidylyltransferase family protein [Psychroflexus sp. YR1-1]|uniref:Acylneuraminate cytidylyltransferase family protein n=1 Tax=Psychroflexus aurantiacus TaxID=2709310 RepID=A0A6B3R066_9FLAO|nr:acylneuraminate cytidylyltransferase family protein [Psychroflexus aurantiacus]NEV93936.1 acylneuraminate cytidylyltransferase family protein [Psychroflexus aurantiacus]
MNHQPPPKILGIIPARGGSKGVPGKNIKDLGGKPLLAYTVESAKQSKLINRLIVSSENENIIKVARNLGVEVPFKRPENLAADQSGSVEVVQHAVEYMEDQGEYYDTVLLLQVTSPFREDGFIGRAIEKFIKSEADALVSVLPVPQEYNPHWVFEADEQDNLKISTGEEGIIKRRQDLPKAFFRDGSIYITKTDVIKKGSFFGNKLTYIESNPELYVNIDTMEDWEKAVMMVKKINS